MFVYRDCFFTWYVIVFLVFTFFFFFKQKTAYEMRISDWSSDVCSSDLRVREGKARRIDLPDQVFSRVHVDDIACGVIAALEANAPPGAYNLEIGRASCRERVCQYV